jgi:aquaporin Z
VSRGGDGAESSASSREHSPGLLTQYERSLDQAFADFDNSALEGRRLFAEFLGTFFLVLVAAGAGMVGHAFAGSISRAAAVTSPGLMVMAIILFMGRVSGAHLNPAVTMAFAARGDFPVRRVPGYVVVQLIGAALAAWFLTALVGVSARFGGTYPGVHVSGGEAFLMEAVLTLGLVSVILGVASRAQNVGVIAAIGVGGYIALAGLWSSPLSAASMNPARSFGPDLVAGHWESFWVYGAGPLAGGLAAVVAAWILRGPGGDSSALAAAQGTLRRMRRERRQRDHGRAESPAPAEE